VFISQICHAPAASFFAANSTFEPSKEMRGSAAQKKSCVKFASCLVAFSNRTILLPAGNLSDNLPLCTDFAWTKMIAVWSAPPVDEERPTA
jgi:hypothetical protein